MTTVHPVYAEVGDYLHLPVEQVEPLITIVSLAVFNTGFVRSTEFQGFAFGYNKERLEEVVQGAKETFHFDTPPTNLVKDTLRVLCRLYKNHLPVYKTFCGEGRKDDDIYHVFILSKFHHFLEEGRAFHIYWMKDLFRFTEYNFFDTERTER